MINNSINELWDDDEDCVNSKDTSFTVDDNYDYHGIVDFDSLFERQRLYYEITEGITIHNTSSDDNSSSKHVPSSSANSERRSLSKSLIHLNFNLYCGINKIYVVFVLIVDSDNKDIRFGIDEEMKEMSLFYLRKARMRRSMIISRAALRR